MSAKMSQRMKLALVCLYGLQLAAHLAECQFLQPQSHLGRLVQSITSPLVLSSAYAGDSSLGDSDIEQALGEPTATGEKPQHFQLYQQQQQQQQQQAAAASRQPARSQFNSRPQALQQAPSQERGVPQYFHHQRQEEEEAPSVAHRQRSAAAAQEYQMGAYLGPAMDDKEIQGAFNSKDDERDEDEGAAGFMGPPPSGVSGRERAANSAYSATEGAGPYGGSASYGPSSLHNEASQLGGASSSSYDDDNSADEDDEPLARQPARFRSSGNALNQAASQYHQRRQQQHQQQQQQRQQRQHNSQQMQAAANGYAPYGYPAGNGAPIDLSSLMAAAAAGGDQTGGYEVYNGDGSYPGAGYYQQQGNGNARRRPAATNSMNAGPYGPYGQQQQQQQRPVRGDNDEQDADSDDD